MGELELGYEPLESACFFERVEVLTLDVLDECDSDRGLVGNVADHRWNFAQTCHLRGSPATFTGDDFVALRFPNAWHAHRADDDGLDDALRLYGVGQLLQRFGP